MGAPLWSLFSAHGIVLISVGSGATIRDIAARAGITVFEAHRYLEDLREAGYVRRAQARAVYVRVPRAADDRYHEVAELADVLAAARRTTAR